MANFSAKHLEHIIAKTGLQNIFEASEDLSDGETYTIRAARNPQQEKELNELHGVDPDLMVRNVLVNEVFAALSKTVFKKIDDAEETLSPFSHKLLITGVRVASCLQDDEKFQASPIDGARANSGFYCIGKISEAELIVNPFISWSQTHSLALDLEEPVKFSIEEDDSETHRGLLLRVSLPEKLKASVWNCPQEILDRL